MTGTAARPLEGWRVLVPRGGVWGSELVALLTDAGATAVVVPLIAFEAPEDETALRAAVERLGAGAYDWLIVTSATTVDALVRLGASVPDSTRIAAVGGHTASALRGAGFRADFVPEHDTSARGIVEEWPDGTAGEPRNRRERVLLPQSELADATLLEGLSALGLEIDQVTAYRTVAARPPADLAARVGDGAFDAILVTAGSVAARVADEFPVIPASTRIVVIGPRTAGEAASAGLSVTAIAEGRSGRSMVDTLIALARKEA